MRVREIKEIKKKLYITDIGYERRERDEARSRKDRKDRLCT